MRTLVFWGDAPLSRARARAERGDVILLWGRRDAGADEPRFKSADWSAEKAARIEAAVAEWTAGLARQPLLEGKALPDLFHWQGLSLWPLVEHYFLGASSAAAGCIRLVESFALAFESELPDEVEAVGLGDDEVRLLERCCTAKGVLFQGESRGRGRRGSLETPGRESQSILGRLRSLGSAFAPKPMLDAGTILFVIPEGAPEGSGEALERSLPAAREGLKITVVGGANGLSPESVLDADAREAIRRAETGFHAAFTALKEAPSTVAAFCHDHVSFADLAATADLGALLRSRLPGAVKRGEGLGALFRSVSPKGLCVHAEDLLAAHAGHLAGLPVEVVSGAEDISRALHALDSAANEGGMVG